MTVIDTVIADRLEHQLRRTDETRAERIARCRDPAEFFATYLPHYFSDPFGPQQKRFFTVLRDEWGDLKLVMKWPRDHGKTTSASPGLVLHAKCYGGSRYIALIRNEETAARELLEGLKGEMEENELLIEDFGPFLDLDATKERTKKVWQQRQIVTLDGTRIRAFGKKAKFRGLKHRQNRPDLIVFDDIQEPEDCENQEQRDKDAKRVLSSWIPALAPGGNIIGIGNTVHWDCVIERLSKKGSGFRVLSERAVLRNAKHGDLWAQFAQIYGDGQRAGSVRRARGFYEQNRKAMDLGTRVLWPARLPYRRLMEIKAVIGPVIFETEYQNHAYDPETQPWRREQIQTFNLRELADVRLRALIVADPAKQKGYGRNKQAWALIGQHPKTGDIYVPAAWKGKKPDTGIVDEWFDAYLTWDAWTPLGVIRFWLEETGSMLLGPMLNDRSLRDGVNLPLKAFPAHDNKINRDSAALDPLITYRRLWIEESLTWLLDDLANFPHGDLDVIDCLAHGVGFLRQPRGVKGVGGGHRRAFAAGRAAAW